MPIEFHHVMPTRDASEHAPSLSPPTQKMPLASLSANGLLVWLPDGSLVHGDWAADGVHITRRDGGSALRLADVHAWAPLPLLASARAPSFAGSLSGSLPELEIDPSSSRQQDLWVSQ
jgi:hypothetical protein